VNRTFLYLLVALFLPSFVSAQTPSPADSPWPINSLPAHHWRTKGRDIRMQQDDVPKDIRAMRNNTMLHFPMSPGEGISITNPNDEIDIPRSNARDIYVVATSVKTLFLPVVRTEQQKSEDTLVYSEMRFRVDRIVHNNSLSTKLGVGDLFDVDFPGGTLTDASGHTVSYPLTDLRFNPLPDRQYLLMVYHLSDTSYRIIFCWEIIDEHLVPNGLIDTIKVRRGSSALNNISLEDAINRILDNENIGGNGK